jgi:hypothetical protein
MADLDDRFNDLDRKLDQVWMFMIPQTAVHIVVVVAKFL